MIPISPIILIIPISLIPPIIPILSQNSIIYYNNNVKANFFC